MSDVEQENKLPTLAQTLGPQFGSSSKVLAEGDRDITIFAYTSLGEIIALAHLLYRGEVDKNRYYNFFAKKYLALTQSVEGRGSKRAIDGIAAESGSQSPSFTNKPNIVARNVWKRDWREKAEREGKTVVE